MYNEKSFLKRAIDKWLWTSEGQSLLSKLLLLHNCTSLRVSGLYAQIRLTTLCPGLPGWAGTIKVKPIWILRKQETVSGIDISWTICKSASRSRQIAMPARHHSVFYRPDALPAAQPTAWKHWRQYQWSVAEINEHGLAHWDTDDASYGWSR